MSLALLLFLLGCATPVASITVSAPKVYGDDQVLNLLDARGRALQVEGEDLRGAEVQEDLRVRSQQTARTSGGVNLLDPDTPVEPRLIRRPRGRDRSRRRLGGRRYWTPRPRTRRVGLSATERLRQAADRGQHLAGYELLYGGDVELLGRRTRVALLRFEVSFTRHLELGDERRFALVRFRVEGKGQAPAPAFRVYLLSPEYSARTRIESSRARQERAFAARILGAAGGIGLGASHARQSVEAHRFAAAVETPTQFAIYSSKESRLRNGFDFAFAFGPQRRLRARSLLNPARWFGSDYATTYEIPPGPRACHALLVFPDLAGAGSVELTIRVTHDGRLLAADDVDLGPALGRGRARVRASAFDLKLPGRGAQRQDTTEVQLDPRVLNDLLLESNVRGPSFSARSQVYLGPLRLTKADVQRVGRGRLAVRVPPSVALQVLCARGQARVQGRVVTPDQPDLVFAVRLSGRRP